MLYFIVNEKSKTGKSEKVWSDIKKMLADQSIDYRAWTTEYQGHATDIAAELSQKLPEDEVKLIVLGGDGTLNEVVNGITDFDKIKIGVITSGSGNDFARGIDHTIESIEDALAYVKRVEEDSYEELVIDLGRVFWKGAPKPRYFTISAGFGLDAIVCKKALTSKIKKFLNAIHLGSLTYVVLTIITLFAMKTENVSIIFDGDRKMKLKKFIFGAMMNLKAEGGGVKMAPDASYTDGKLSMCAGSGIPKLITFFFLPILAAGKHEKLHGFKLVDYEKCLVHCDGPMTLHTDGEYVADITDAKFECVKGVLHVMK